MSTSKTTDISVMSDDQVEAVVVWMRANYGEVVGIDVDDAVEWCANELGFNPTTERGLEDLTMMVGEAFILVHREHSGCPKSKKRVSQIDRERARRVRADEVTDRPDERRRGRSGTQQETARCRR